jgi:chemotaxis protein methyltransferase CheR
MPKTRATPPLTDDAFDALASIVHDRVRLRLDPKQRQGLQARLADRLAALELDTFGQYLRFLTAGPYQHDEFQELLTLIEPGEAAFFEHQAQLDAFERIVLPELLETRKDSRHLRIWSAACGNGAEPYTLAILINESLGARAGDWHVEVMGTDLAQRRLATANGGIYASDALRGTPDHLKRRYFKRTGKGWALSDEILQMASFEPHDLTDRIGAKRYGTWDAIFCRRRLPGYDDQARRVVLDVFYEHLADHGTLFLGPDETIQPGQPRFVARTEHEGWGYRKG